MSGATARHQAPEAVLLKPEQNGLPVQTPETAEVTGKGSSDQLAFQSPEAIESPGIENSIRIGTREGQLASVTRS